MPADNMVAAQNRVQILLGADNRDNNTTNIAATIVSKSVHEYKTVQFECLLQVVPVASCCELKRGATQGCDDHAL